MPKGALRLLPPASDEARLPRRAKELSGAPDHETIERTRRIVSERDRRDSAVTAFMEASDGVITIDSSTMSIADVVETIENLAGRLT